MRNLFTLASFLVLSLFAFSLEAQRDCGAMEHLEQQIQQHPDIEMNMQRIERFTQEYIRTGANQRAVSGVITIPVVVHIVYGNGAENISDAQVQSQIDVLNEDFRRTNADAANTPNDFIGVAADTEIEFCLATVDENGAPTSGITRTATTVGSFGTNDAVKFNSSGGKDAWNTSQYLNIWVCDLGSSLLGYAQFPGGPAASDGVVCHYQAFGRGPYSLYSSFALGRTTSHEVGHWLNLRHIWGDGPCSFDDFVDDTPEASGPNYTGGDCVYPGPNSCRPKGKAGRNDLPDMFQNYMDYSDDVCMNLFTLGQTDRMRALFEVGGARESLLSSPGCGTGNPVEICDDGVDNDGDGLTDCDDPDCDSDPSCAPVEPEICNDGIDNDGDGLTDCDDPDCSEAPACQPTGDCNAPGGLSRQIKKGGKEVDLSWNAVSGAVSYTVTLTNLSSGGSDERTVSGTTTTFSGLSKNSDYEWCVSTNCSSQSSDAACATFTAAPGGRTTRWAESPMRVYPNPARNQFTVQLNLSGKESPNLNQVEAPAVSENYQVWVMDAFGRVVRRVQTQNAEETVVISTNGLASGLYLVKVTDAEGKLESSRKVVISK